MPVMAAMARRHQPGLIIADRTVGGLYENILTPEQEVPDAPLGHPWETCMTMGTSWAYVEGDTYKPARQIIHTLVDIVAKDGNLLLNIGPSPRGTFAPDALERLRAIGDWMAVNGEAIHGSRAIAPYIDGDIRYTSRGATVYAIVLAGEGRDRPDDEVALTSLRPLAGAPVHMLGVDAPLPTRATAAGMCVTLPTGHLPCKHAWVLRFEQA